MGILSIGNNYGDALKYGGLAFEFLSKEFEFVENVINERSDRINLGGYKSRIFIELKKHEKSCNIILKPQ
jgi:hypothetical protein